MSASAAEGCQEGTNLKHSISCPKRRSRRIASASAALSHMRPSWLMATHARKASERRAFVTWSNPFVIPPCRCLEENLQYSRRAGRRGIRVWLGFEGWRAGRGLRLTQMTAARTPRGPFPSGPGVVIYVPRAPFSRDFRSKSHHTEVQRKASQTHTGPHLFSRFSRAERAVLHGLISRKRAWGTHLSRLHDEGGAAPKREPDNQPPGHRRHQAAGRAASPI
jgi:hypothetical protein